MLAGIYPIVPTPFDEHGAVDVDSITTMTDFMVGLGVNGLAVLGVMGEADRLTDHEREEVVHAFRAALPRECALVVGAGGAGTDAAIHACRRALDLGADALLVGPPRIQNDGVLFSYYERIARAVGTSIVIHDYPASTGVVLSAELLARLHKELDGVRYVKLEDPPTGPKMERLTHLVGKTFGVFGALGGLYALEELERGAVGIMTGFSYPELLVRLYALYREDKISEAAELFYAILPLIRFEFQPGVGVSLRKTVLVRRGAMKTATVRHPGATADPLTLAQLSRIVEYLVARGYIERTGLATHRQ
jgi:4-hydroxy-tetrahydrodipicolinate synthase